MMDSDDNDGATHLRSPYIREIHPCPQLYADLEKGNGEGNSYLGASPPDTIILTFACTRSVVGKVNTPRVL